MLNIHAICFEKLNGDKSGFAFPQLDRLLVAKPDFIHMYNQHTSRDFCQFSAKSCRKAMENLETAPIHAIDRESPSQEKSGCMLKLLAHDIAAYTVMRSRIRAFRVNVQPICKSTGFRTTYNPSRSRSCPASQQNWKVRKNI